MKTRCKALLLSLCAVLLVTVSVLGTMAYLTDKDQVVNSFTVGSVAITLDELDVTKTDGSRTDANTYHLLPGHKYDKDPTVHVKPVSEDSWLFVKVENDIAAYEAATEEGGYTSIADQIIANEWTKLAGVDNVYYKSYAKNDAGADLVVFEKFQIADEANKVKGWADITSDTTKVTVTAYAVQKDGFDTALAAWNVTFGK